MVVHFYHQWTNGNNSVRKYSLKSFGYFFIIAKAQNLRKITLAKAQKYETCAFIGDEFIDFCVLTSWARSSVG